MTEYSVINLGELSKPATVLIEKLSEAVGGIARPFQIKRVASAEAEAEKIKAIARLEINEIEQAALVRAIKQMAKDQQNIENITKKAIPFLNEDAKPELLDEDFLRFVVDRARIVSDDDMQTIWSKIISGEANTPGSFSKKTVEIVSYLSKEDAALFSRFCSHIWNIGKPTVVVKLKYENNPEKCHISFDEFNHLEDLGLISFNSFSGYVQKGEFNEGSVEYFGFPLYLNFSDAAKKDQLSVGNAILTKAGTELSRIAGAQPSSRIFIDTIEYWQAQGIICSSFVTWKESFQGLWNE